MAEPILPQNVIKITDPPVRFVPISDKDYIQLHALAAALTALALATVGEVREGVILAAIAAGMKVTK
jgi:hypothetical protein